MDNKLATIQQNLAAAQAQFLALLAHHSPDSLHRQIDSEPWTPAVIMLHMCEARTHYAADVGRLLDTDFAAVVGRSTDDPRRLAQIAAAAAGTATAATIGERLEVTFAEMMSVLARVAAADLDRPVTLARPGFAGMRLAEFLDTFLVGHHQMHVAQLSAISNEGSAG